MSHTLPALFADMSLPSHGFGIHSDTAPGSEAFVAMTLGFLVFLFIGFALGGFVLWRRERHPEPHMKLLMELEEEEEADENAHPAQPSTAGDRPPAQPEPKAWEREADWWRKPE